MENDKDRNEMVKPGQDLNPEGNISTYETEEAVKNRERERDSYNQNQYEGMQADRQQLNADYRERNEIRVDGTSPDTELYTPNLVDEEQGSESLSDCPNRFNC